MNEPGRHPQRGTTGKTEPINPTWETAMNRLTATILTTTLAATAQLAHAANPIDDSRRHIEVHYADLNLSTTEGTAMLYRRLQSAAENVCSEHGAKGVESVFRVKACMSAAISTAVTQIDRPVLTSYYRTKVGGTTAAVRQAAR
jgi:UrcA family protein